MQGRNGIARGWSLSLGKEPVYSHFGGKAASRASRVRIQTEARVVQNFIKGIVVGGAVAGLGLGVVSQLAPLPSTQPAVQISAVPPEPVAKAVLPAPDVNPPAAQDPSAAPAVTAVAPVVPEPPVNAPAPEVVGMTPPLAAALPSEPATLPEVSAADPAPDPAAKPATEPPAPATDDALLAAVPLSPQPAPAPLVIDTPDPAPAVLSPEPLVPEVILPAVVAPASELPKTVEGVTIGRLPSIGAAPAAQDAVAPEPSNPDLLDPELADAPPLLKFARAFTNEAAKPLFAVVLQDSGAADLDRQALAALPFPISFVLDPTNPTASEAEKVYRAANQEVVMLASGLPAGATPSDLEQSFQVNDAVLPEAVAVMDLAKGGFQDNRGLATEVVSVVKTMGRGLLTFDRGLNPADQIARRQGLASALIFRTLDAQGETAPVIRRYLDRAAFKAAQEGRVVVLGTTSPEMISALMEWAVEGRGASVALAPISAVLTP